MTYDIPDWLDGLVKVDEHGCWIWQRRIAWNGYGEAIAVVLKGLEPTTRVAHRAVYRRSPCRRLTRLRGGSWRVVMTPEQFFTIYREAME